MSGTKSTVESFTVSTMFETHKGSREQHFVSATVRLEPPASMDEFLLRQLDAALQVSVAAVYDALMRGALTVEEANSKISTLRGNHEALAAKLASKRTGALESRPTEKA